MITGILSEFPRAAAPISAGLCDTQPITAEGFRALLAASPDLECRWLAHSLPLSLELARRQTPDLVVIDKAFGLQPVLDVLPLLRSAGTAAVVWGVALSEAEALRLLQGGACGILHKTADLSTILACLRAVAQGSNWMDDCVFRDAFRQEQPGHSDLTPREFQVLALVEQGMKNREIAQELGIRSGTVKIHLKHIFEKTGVHGRYGLALNGLRQRDMASEPSHRREIVA